MTDPLDGAPPAPDPESLHRAKLAALEERMAEAGLDALVVQDMHSLRWLTGYSPFMRITPPTGQVAVVRPGEPVRLIPIPYYVGDARRRAPWLDVVEGDTPVADLVAGARRVGLVGVTWQLGATLSPPADLVNATDLVMRARADKVPGEADLVERALAVARVGMRAACAAAGAGVSEEEVAAEAERAIRVAGGDGHAIVGRGATAAGLTELAGPDRLRAGDCVLADIGCYLDGYRGEFARTLAIDEPPATLVRAHAATREALEAAEEALGDGVPADRVAAAARERLEALGYPAATLPYPVGHGLGASGGEPPAIERGSSDTVSAGEVLNLEPGVFDPATDLAVRIEDTYVVEPGGARRLTPESRDLVVC